MTKKNMIIGIIISLWGISGCTAARQGETALERNWGRSFESARYNQISNPNAGADPTPVAGFDGGAAVTSMAEYHKTFKRKIKRPAVNINLSGLGGN